MKKRNLYLKNTPPDEALAMYLKELSPYLLRMEEEVTVFDCLDRVTAKAVFARFNSPLYDSAAMDGIAVISSHTFGARETNPVILRPKDDYVVVDTGDPVRPPYDAVIMAEDLEEMADGAVLIRGAATAWNHVRPIGEDIVKGELILPSGHKIRPIDIGVLLSGGITTLSVIRRPKVAIFPTGTELIEADCQPEEGDIVESNSRMFEALVIKGGGLPTRHSPLMDDYDSIKKAIKKAAAEYDFILINAGSSAGSEDYTVDVLRELGEVIIHGVAIKPGKPTILAIVNNKPVIGLPGYPVSAYIAYQNFAAQVLAWLAATPTESMTTIPAIVTRRLVSSLKYREYVRVKVGLVGARMICSPLARGAGSAMSLVRADGFCIIDQNSEGVEAGQEVNVILNRDISELSGTLVSIGSHDLILDLISDIMTRQFSNKHLSSTHVGSLGGLMALQRGEAHIAPVHLLDETSGSYNIPMIKKLFANREMALIKGVGRVQGFIIKKGNPLHITGIESLPQVRYINRQRGAGTRLLLDYKLNLAGIDSAAITGYDREAATHMAVAAAVLAGTADAGMGIFSAANSMDLDFVAVGGEEYDFAIPVEFLDLPSTKAFLQVLKSDVFKEKLSELGGYTCDHCGEIIIINQHQGGVFVGESL